MCGSLGSVITSLPTDQEVPGVIPASGIVYCDSRYLLHDVCGLSGVCVFQCHLPMFYIILGKGPSRLGETFQLCQRC